jgi:hypothetical protein
MIIRSLQGLSVNGRNARVGLPMLQEGLAASWRRIVFVD